VWGWILCGRSTTRNPNPYHYPDGNQDKALAIESLKQGAQDYLNKNQMDGDL